nr:nicotianamine synthase 2 [Quercus suber]
MVRQAIMERAWRRIGHRAAGASLVGLRYRKSWAGRARSKVIGLVIFFTSIHLSTASRHSKLRFSETNAVSVSRPSKLTASSLGCRARISSRRSVAELDSRALPAASGTWSEANARRASACKSSRDTTCRGWGCHRTRRVARPHARVELSRHISFGETCKTLLHIFELVTRQSFIPVPPNPMIARMEPDMGMGLNIGRYALTLPHHEDSSERIILGILTLFDELNALTTLEPDEKNGRLFNQLFDLVTMSKTTAAMDAKIMNDPRIAAIIPRLWDIWGSAEYCLERGFAEKVNMASTSSESLEIYHQFPYLDQYRQLARMESNTIDAAIGELGLQQPRKIAFLGSGPTPFSSLCFQERYASATELLNIDRNPEAIALSKKLVHRCGFSRNITFSQCDVGSPELPDLKDYDVVHFAALIGESQQEKNALLRSVAMAMRPGALILLRSTDGLRTALYPRVELDEEILEMVTPVVSMRSLGGSSSLTAIVVSVDGVPKGKHVVNCNGHVNGNGHVHER